MADAHKVMIMDVGALFRRAPTAEAESEFPAE
ncbi:hypothetical protein SMALA_6338 [Streptomyces malaysiensis subsp. malaysiensis]|nr:hypothetical protein SMALA_6338 [Streptomyces malaysiensis]